MSVHSVVNAHMGHFHPLAIVNGAAMNIAVQVFIGTTIFNSLGSIPKSGLAESQGNYMLNVLRNCHGFPQQWDHAMCPPAVSSVLCAVLHFFDCSHPSGCDAGSFWGVDLHFPSG